MQAILCSAAARHWNKHGESDNIGRYETYIRLRTLKYDYINPCRRIGRQDDGTTSHDRKREE
jgi:hypothetical protein